MFVLYNLISFVLVIIFSPLDPAGLVIKLVTCTLSTWVPNMYWDYPKQLIGAESMWYWWLTLEDEIMKTQRKVLGSQSREEKLTWASCEKLQRKERMEENMCGIEKKEQRKKKKEQGRKKKTGREEWGKLEMKKKEQGY